VPGIGETLREARMRQHLDITDVEGQTKIRAKYLRALENEDFGMLPGATFVKSFLRTYAEFLGLDPHLLVEEYRVRHDPRDESELTPFQRPPRSRDRRRRPPPRRPAWLPVALAVAGILALLLVLGLTGDDGGGDETASPPATTTADTRSAAERRAARERRERRERREARERRERRAAAREVRLRVVPAGPTYVCVDKGAGTDVVYEGTLDGPKTWVARHLRVNLGRRAVTLTKNRRRVRIPAGSDPIGFDFTPTRTRELPSGQRPCA
jgi:cytoskeletal protein RodZ